MKHRAELERRYPEVYKNLIEAEIRFQESMFLNNIIAMNADTSLTALCKDVLKEMNARNNEKIDNG